MVANGSLDASAVAVFGTVVAGALWAIAAGEMGLGNRRALPWLDAAAVGATLVALVALVVGARREPVTSSTEAWELAIGFGLWGLVVGFGLALRYVTRVWDLLGRDARWRAIDIVMLVPAFVVAGCVGGCGVGMLAVR